jgi:hypothetical protein
LPGDGEYDRKEKEQAAFELRQWLKGCALVVVIIILTYVLYAFLLIRNGWHG